MTAENQEDLYSKMTLEGESDPLSEAGTKLEMIKKHVKHGKLKVKRRKIKAQVLKKSRPKDYEREKICKKARKKAHTVIANARRNISNNIRKGLHDGLEVVNPKATTISEAFGLDFMEEAAGYDVAFDFFDKPITTPITESVNLGLTPTGRKRKCKAIGVAEGCFQPITTPDGERVYSRNKRLYDVDHWAFQLNERGLTNRVNNRDMAGTIGHHDKRVDDEDFANEKVSHIVTNLELREDEEHGLYLWGRLEILNTQAGRALKTYYESDIPLYVSSRGGGKLIELPGKEFKRVDKTKYFCETFDVVRAPGFLDAMPIYYNVLTEENDIDDDDTDTSDVNESKLLTGCENTEHLIKEDIDMTKVNCNITADTTLDEVTNKLLKPMSEKIAELTDVVKQLADDIYEAEETEAVEAPKAEEAPVAEPAAEEAPAEEKVAEVEEAPAEEPKAEEAPAEEKAEEAPAQEPEGKVSEAEEEPKAEEVPADEEPAKEEAPAEEKVAEAEEAPAEEPKAEEAPAEEAPAEEPKAEEIAEGDKEAEKCPDCGKDKKDAKKDCKDCDDKDKKEAEKVDEQWAHEDPKETAPATKDPHTAKVGEADKPMTGDVYAHEDPKETAPAKNAIADGQKAPKEVVAKEKAAKICEGEDEGNATEEGVEVIDYKAMYEEQSKEIEDTLKVIDEMIETFKDFGKRHREIVENYQSEIKDKNLQLNSYKLSETFNITVDDAKAKLSSKTYEEVVEELKAEEANKVEQEAQAVVEKVSESITEEHVKQAPAPRKVYSVFSAEKEVISEEKVEETKNPRVFSWF